MVRRMQILRRFRQSTCGAAMIETTFVILLLFVLIGGMVDFGFAFYQWNAASKAVQVGTRLLAVSNPISSDLARNGIRDSARYLARCNTLGPLNCDLTKAKNIAIYGDDDGGGTPRIDGWTASEISISFINTTNNIVGGLPQYRGNSIIQTVRVTSSHSYTGMALLRFLFVNPVVLNTAHEERVIGW